jgi:hypothetical protein
MRIFSTARTRRSLLLAARRIDEKRKSRTRMVVSALEGMPKGAAASSTYVLRIGSMLRLRNTSAITQALASLHALA